MKGFTVIEAMIIIAIVGIGIAIAIPTMTGQKQQDFVCISGYKFVRGGQLIGQNGGGVPCSVDNNQNNRYN